MIRQHILLLILVTLFLGSCKKFLDEKPNKSLVILRTPGELQALLDENRVTNYAPWWLEWGADNFYVETHTWKAYPDNVRNAYIWADDIIGSRADDNWTYAYQYAIAYPNAVLEAIADQYETTSTAEKSALDFVKGQALYYRSYAFWGLAQVYARPYDAATASADLGIVLRTTTNLNVVQKRSSVKETYDRIIADLLLAKDLLPAFVDPVRKNRPSRPTAFAMLSRVYLSMSDYANAKIYADSCLNAYSTLFDFNERKTSTAERPLPAPNPETLQYYPLQAFAAINASVLVDTSLFRSYAVNDLRRTLYFKNLATKPYFRGQFEPFNAALNSGLSVGEMYLTRAECYARVNKVTEAMSDLNTLLQKRWNNEVVYEALTASDAEEALDIILTERRKELIFRGLRWMDLRRLNKEARYAKTLKRVVDGVEYQLLPGSNKYVYQIPLSEIRLSGIEQNIR